MGGMRWNRPEEGCLAQLTALWSGMAAPVVFLVNEWRISGSGTLEVRSGEGCPYVALLPTAEPMVLLVEQVAA